MSKPLVSVIICTYNAENFICDTLDSIIQQSYENIEIIVVDDCSSDNTRDVLDDYVQKGQIIPLYLSTNRNMCYAANTGIKLAKGKYIALCGHDDVWKSGKIEKQVQYMEEHGECGVCFTLCEIIDDYGNIKPKEKEELYKVFDRDNMDRKSWFHYLMKNSNCFCAPSALVRKEFLRNKLYIYSSLQVQDYELWMYLLVKHEIYVIQERLTKYRQFDKVENLSKMDNKKLNRMGHELDYIQYRLIMDMDRDDFIYLYQENFRNDDSSSEQEIRCEKFFVLLETFNSYALITAMDMMESDEMRELLEQKYDYTLKEMYALSTMSIPFNRSDYFMLEDYKRVLSENQQLKEIVVKFEEIVKKLQGN